MATIYKHFQNFGISDKQTAVYIACLELSAATVYMISKKVNISRSSIYGILEELKKNNLVSSYKKNNILYFTAENPNNVIKIAEEKVKNLQDAIPQLTKLYNTAKKPSSVRVFHNTYGIKIVLNELLQEAEDFVAFSSPDEMFKALNKYWLDFISGRINKKIPYRIIFNQLPSADELQNLDVGPLIGKIKIIPPQFKYYESLMIWGNKVAMFSLKKEKFTTVIENNELSKLHRTFFDFIWSALDKDNY